MYFVKVFFPYTFDPNSLVTCISEFNLKVYTKTKIIFPTKEYLQKYFSEKKQKKITFQF